MRRKRLLLLSSLFLAGCSAPEVFPGGREFVVKREAEYFCHGPAQPGRPEKLPSGTFLQVLSKDSAYSYVKIADGRTGYVATENIAPAPPTAPAVPFDPPEKMEIFEPPAPDFREVPAEIPDL